MKEVRAIIKLSIPMPNVDPASSSADRLDAAIVLADEIPLAGYVVSVTTETIEPAREEERG